jgi:hypothetical protein
MHHVGFIILITMHLVTHGTNMFRKILKIDSDYFPKLY